MRTKSMEKLFTEACGLTSIPSATSKIVQEAFKFCEKHNLDCGIEPGTDSPTDYCFWVLPVNHDRWFINAESKSLTQACFHGVAIAWSNMHGEREHKIVNLEAYKHRMSL
jgi:hypothetical protein